MNNKKIIFGILLFCAISFIAYTFANPLEEEKGEGKLMPGNSTPVSSPNNNKPDDEEEEPKIETPATEEPSETEPTQPVVITTPKKTTTKPSASTTPSNASTPVNNAVEVSGISVETSMPTLAVGKTVKLGVSVSPSNATNQNVTYTSSNPNVATVDENGNVTGIGAGTTVITVTSNNGKTNTVTITIVNNMTSSVKIISANAKNTTITDYNQVGDSLTLYGNVTPNGSDFKIKVQITVPGAYNLSILNDLKYYLGDNGYGIPQTIYQGTSRIKTEGNESYVEFNIPFREKIINSHGRLDVIVDWLGNNIPKVYTLDFSGMNVIVNE